MSEETEIPTIGDLVSCGYSWWDAAKKRADLVFSYRADRGTLISEPPPRGPQPSRVSQMVNP